MYLIILAAGQGTRLRPITDTKPKCLVEVAGKAMLEWQLSAAKSIGLKDIAVVSGYKREKIDYPGITYFENARYDSTNMVETLWCAEPVFGDGFIVSYGDIIYEPQVLQKLLASEAEISVVIDQDWQPYWQKRFDNVLDDAETLQVDHNGRILDIGQKPQTLEQIQGQYIGLMAFKGHGVGTLRSVYKKAHEDANLGEKPLGCSRPVDNLYMTDILQGIIDNGVDIYQTLTRRGWLEIDSIKDLKLAERLVKVNNGSFFITN